MKKERELHYLKKAQAIYTGLPQSDPIHSESPDFLFQIGSTVLGIEMTDFVRRLNHSSLTLRTIENLHKMVANNAKAKFESKHGISLWTGLHWDNRFRFSKKDVDGIASELAALIETDIPPAANDGTVFNWESHGDLPIFDAIHRVSVRRLRNRAKGVWSAIEAGFIGGAISDIQEIVDLKESKIASYLSRCGEVWLLIVADGAHISSTLDLDLEPNSTLRTGFSRVLFYNGDSKTVARLK